MKKIENSQIMILVQNAKCLLKKKMVKMKSMPNNYIHLEFRMHYEKRMIHFGSSFFIFCFAIRIDQK